MSARGFAEQAIATESKQVLNDIHKVYEAVAKPLVVAYHFFDVSPKSNWVAHPDSGMRVNTGYRNV